MKKSEVKAFIHRNRVADVVNALNSAGFRNITVVDVEGLLKALSSKEQSCSVEIGQKVVKEVKLELVCDTDKQMSCDCGIDADDGQSVRRWAGPPPQGDRCIGERSISDSQESLLQAPCA